MLRSTDGKEYVHFKALDIGLSRTQVTVTWQGDSAKDLAAFLVNAMAKPWPETARYLRQEGTGNATRHRSPGTGEVAEGSVFIEVSRKPKPVHCQVAGVGFVVAVRPFVSMWTVFDANRHARQVEESARATAFVDFVLDRMLVPPKIGRIDIARLDDNAVAPLVAIAADAMGIREQFDRQPADLTGRERLFRAYFESFHRSFRTAVSGLVSDVAIRTARQLVEQFAQMAAPFAQFGRLQEAVRNIGLPNLTIPSILPQGDRIQEAWPLLGPDAVVEQLLPNLSYSSPRGTPPIRDLHLVALSDSDEEEFQSCRFKSRIPIVVTGQLEARRGNVIKMANAEVILPDAEFKLLLRLVVALYETPDGYVSQGNFRYGGGLADEGFYLPEGQDQAVGRLRGRLPGFFGVKRTQLIEVTRGQIRLSTHRGYISWDRDKLLRHPDAIIRELVRRLPKGHS